MNSPDKIQSVFAGKARVKKAFTFTDVCQIVGVAPKKLMELTIKKDIKPVLVEGYGKKKRAVFSEAQVTQVIQEFQDNPPTRQYRKREKKETDRELSVVHAIMAVRDELAKARVATENMVLRTEVLAIQIKRVADACGVKPSPQAIKEFIDTMRTRKEDEDGQE